MSDALFSPAWYRVANLALRLRSHAQIHRHLYRGEVWYVLQDRSNARFHRFSPAAYHVIGLLNGRATVQAVWEEVCAKLGDDAPTQGEIIQLLGQLHAADLLQGELSPDTTEIFHRFETQRQRKWQRRLMSVFSWQIPLWDPERFLTRLLPFVRPFFGWRGALLWCALVVPALFVGASHWHDLTSNVLDQVMTPHNLVVLWFLFPAIKLLHELGHAFAVKAFGGEVHDLGVMFLVFTPVPYVDASASWAFSRTWQRVAVGAAGMLVELALAAIAMFVWLSVEPGAVRTLAYNAIMVAGISTVIFNGNPLLQFDGYYMLADYLEIPNLKMRANRYLGFLAERYLFGHRDAVPGPATPGERRWFVLYAIAAYVCRILVVVGILLFLTDQLFLLGVIFAGLTACTWILFPLGKGLAFLFTSPRLRLVRGRAMVVSFGVLAGLIGLVCLVPVPYRTRAEGVVWIPEEAHVRAAVDGFVRTVVVKSGEQVLPGDVLVVCEDPVLVSKVHTLEARLDEVTARIREQFPDNLVKAQILAEERLVVEENLVRAREQAEELMIRSQTAGTVVLPKGSDLPGRFLTHGGLVAYVVNLETMTVRTMVEQVDIDLIASNTKQVQVRLAERLADPADARLKRFVPAASKEIPSPALSHEGGGEVPLDPRDPKGHTALKNVFQVDVELPPPLGVLNVGGRVFVRFDHGRSPLAVQWYRKGRQLFLSRFNV
ncbi:efflux RND transporter periplasmic adaptor subunit [Nitrospira lenta]|uniref:Peptidase, M50 family n=1 Tax=Nitrospira lenta TaxID=1436998 RepID=A0A330LAV6_9BACT|nr:efflux RND transporter periplasmic adaptor subunit [Nitrospira lenta]SPP66888.1 Peptidase, M50 family [Nitrospira lenta]